MDSRAEFKSLSQFKALSKDYQNQIKFFYVRSHSISQSTQYLRVEVCKTKFTLLNTQNELFDRNQKQTELMSDLFSQCTLANYENTVWFDVNGFKLVHYFPHLISESLSNDVLNAFHTLTTLYPPHSPGAREIINDFTTPVLSRTKGITTTKYPKRRISLYYLSST